MTLAALVTSITVGGSVASAAPAYNEEAYIDGFRGAVNVDALVPALESTFGSRFGGAWIDRAVTPSVLRVGVRGATAMDRTMLNTLTGWNARVSLISVPHSMSELGAIADRIALIVWKRGATSMVGVETMTNDVLVELPRADASLTLSILAAGPAGTVRLVVSKSVSIERLHTHRTDYPPYEAGLSNVIGGTAGCTSGFMLKNVYNYGTTAGHCGNTGKTVYIGTHHVSDVGTNSFYRENPSQADAARYYTGNPTTRIDTGTNGHRTVRNKFANSSLVMNTRLCFQGVSSDNNNCGNINAVNITFTDSEGTSEHIYCINFPALPGDSGGPVYQVNSDNSAKAAGLVTAGLTIGGVNSMCFSTIAWTENELNATLVTG